MGIENNQDWHSTLRKPASILDQIVIILTFLSYKVLPPIMVYPKRPTVNSYSNQIENYF